MAMDHFILDEAIKRPQRQNGSDHARGRLARLVAMYRYMLTSELRPDQALDVFGIGVRMFYRDVAMLRAVGVDVTCASGTYWVQNELPDERGEDEPTTPEQAPPWLYGVLKASSEALASAAWSEWVSMLDAVSDGDVDLTTQDVAPLLGTYLTLRRRGVVFMPNVRAALDEQAQWMMRYSQDSPTHLPTPAA